MRTWLSQRVPALAGSLLRQVGRGFPGIAGPTLVAVGLGLAWLPLGVIAAGAILWAVDWRIGDAPARPVQVAGRDPGRLRQVA